MLDTIILEFPICLQDIKDFGKFGTTKESVQNYRGFKKWINNPTKEEKKLGIYKPRLTLIKRGLRFYLKVEFSAPKLIFLNNLDELEEKDFDLLLKTLQRKLKEMGVELFKVELEKANVIACHPSKNILITNGYSSGFAIKELSKINISKKFDIEFVKYRNGGSALQIYTNSHSCVFYDKINDLTKPPKRAVDSDQTIRQYSLFDIIKKVENPIEVLRIEIRLSKKKQLNHILEELKYPKNPTLKDIFNKELCQKIVLYYWNQFFSDNLFLFDIQDNPQKILQDILIKYGDEIGIKKAVSLTGFNLLCKDENGMRGFRNIAEVYKPKTNWTKFREWNELLNKEIKRNRQYGFIQDIQRSLEEFKVFRLKSCSQLNCKE